MRWLLLIFAISRRLLLKLLYLELLSNLWKDQRKFATFKLLISLMMLSTLILSPLWSDDLPLEKLKVNIGNSLKSLLTRLRRQEEEKAKEGNTKTEEEGKFP